MRLKSGETWDLVSKVLAGVKPYPEPTLTEFLRPREAENDIHGNYVRTYNFQPVQTRAQQPRTPL